MSSPKRNPLILFFALLTLFLLFPIIYVDADVGGEVGINDSIEAPCDSGGFSNDNCTAPNEVPTGEQVAIITNYTVSTSDAINNNFCLVEDGNPANCSSLGGGTLIDDDCTDNGDIFYITGTPDWDFPGRFSCSYSSTTGTITCDGLTQWSENVYYYINWTLEACAGDRGSSSDIYPECSKLSGGIVVNCDSILLGLNVTNAPPTHTTPIITPYPAYTTDNITCTNQSTSDVEGDSVTNIYNWLKDGTSITVLNMPFDTNVSSAGSKVRDYSGYGNDGGLNPGTAMPTWIPSGKLGGAFSFDGGDFMNISKSSTLNNTYNFTISFWMKPNILTGGGIIFTNREIGTIGSGEFEVYRTTDDVGITVISSDNKVNSNNALQIGVWTHVAITMIESTNISIYINGSYNNADTTVDPGPYMNNSNDFYIGAKGDAASFFNGTLDELKLYNYSLTPQQINRLYIEGLNNYTNSTIVSQETLEDQNWTCEVTPNDAIDDGITKSISRMIGCYPPTDSDWDISIPVICQDKVIYLAQDKNLNVLNGGSLTLINTTLWINQTSDDGSRINVQSGGTMNITDNNGDGSLINSTNTSNEFAFIVDSGSNFSMTSSRLEESGWSTSNSGLEISTTVTEFSGNTLANNYIALTLLSNNNNISNNLIDLSEKYGIYVSESDNNTLTGNNITNTGSNATNASNIYGIFLENSSDNAIKNVRIVNITALGPRSNYSYGIWLFNSDNNNLTSITVTGINISGTSSDYVYGIYLSNLSDNNILEDITITNLNSEDDNTHGIYLSDSSNNNITNATIRDIHTGYGGGKRAYGIHLFNSTSNTITDIVTDKLSGWDDIYGIYFLNSSNNSLTDVLITNTTATDDFAYGVFISDSSGNNLTNITITNTSSEYYAEGTYILSSSDNILNDIEIINTTSIKDWTFGVYLRTSPNNKLTNITIVNTSGVDNSVYGIYFFSSNNNTLTNVIIKNTFSGDQWVYGINMFGSINNIITNTTIDNTSAVTSSGISLFIVTEGNNTFIDSRFMNDEISILSNSETTFINTTFNQATTNISGGTIYVKWYLDVYVTDSYINIIENANVTAWDNSNNLAFSELTGSNGYIERQNLTEYSENATGKYFLTNYAINTIAAFCCESDSRPLNLTESTILNIILTPFYTLQIILNINNTDNTVYIPGTGEIPASQLGPGTNYTNQTHNYLASYNSTSLAALAAQTAIRLFVSNTTTYHTIEIEQLVRNSKIFLVFTKGDWKTIDNRMNLIEAGQFLAKISPSFAFGLGITYPIKLLLSYSDIDIQGDIILQSGRQGLIVNYSETINDTPVIFIRRI